jgi:hypothetical protein
MIRYLTDWVRYVGTGKLLVVRNLSPELRYLRYFTVENDKTGKVTKYLRSAPPVPQIKRHWIYPPNPIITARIQRRFVKGIWRSKRI